MSLSKQGREMADRAAIIFQRTLHGVSDFLALDEKLHLWEKKGEDGKWEFIHFFCDFDKPYAEMCEIVKRAAVILGYEEITKQEKQK